MSAHTHVAGTSVPSAPRDTRSRPRPGRGATGRSVVRPALGLAAAVGVALAVPGIDGGDGRLALAVFLAAASLWVTTDLDETLVAAGAVAALLVAGVVGPSSVAAPLTDTTTWLLVGAFVLAAVVTRTSIPDRLLGLACRRATTVAGLCWWLTLAVGATAFVIPSTSGRAALLVPVYGSLSAALGDRRISRALSLLLPVVVLLTAVASLLGAGAHLVTIDILARHDATAPGFVGWAVLGIPVAALSAGLACAVITRTFLTAEERGREVRGIASTPRPASGSERRVAVVLGGLVVTWVTEPWHGVPAGLATVAAALLLVVGRHRVVSPREAAASVSWSLVGFLVASLVLADVLVATGAADALATGVLAPVADAAPAVVLVTIVAVSVVAHLVVTSRTARSSVLIPVVVPVGVAAGLDPTAVALASTAAAGYCITLPASAKPVALFSKLDDAYAPADLRRLSRRLLPAHVVLFTVVAAWVWPALGLDLTADDRRRPPVDRPAAEAAAPAPTGPVAQPSPPESPPPAVDPEDPPAREGLVHRRSEVPPVAPGPPAGEPAPAPSPPAPAGGEGATAPAGAVPMDGPRASPGAEPDTETQTEPEPEPEPDAEAEAEAGSEPGAEPDSEPDAGGDD